MCGVAKWREGLLSFVESSTVRRKKSRGRNLCLVPGCGFGVCGGSLVSLCCVSALFLRAKDNAPEGDK